LRSRGANEEMNIEERGKEGRKEVMPLPVKE
jgi:hypothetical protein